MLSRFSRAGSIPSEEDVWNRDWEQPCLGSSVEECPKLGCWKLICPERPMRFMLHLSGV